MFAMTEYTTESQSCLELLQQGGGVVNVVYTGSFESLEPAFHPDWIQLHHDTLSMLTLNLPAYGCLSLLHPQITFWEVERNDFKTQEE
jgi:hypothetical protein